MQYFDLHSHPGLKTLFKRQDGSQFTAWHLLHPFPLFGDILSSQCSLQQISSNTGIPLVCVTLHAPEAGMINQFSVRMGAATVYKDFMDEDRLEDMWQGRVGYQEVFGQELVNLALPPAASDSVANPRKLVFLQSWGDYDPAIKDNLYVIFNIEGGHNLYDQGNQLVSVQSALDNLDRFLQKGYLTLYLTPTHLTPNAFINHAYGNKILTKGPLLPQGKGITPAGKDLISFAYDKGLLIDVKHMSLLARLQFYRIHERYFPDKPIIASHIGLTGMPISEWLGWVRRVTPMGSVVELMSYKYQWQGLSFYPLSINLFTEDIIAILKSGGLIGISMDVRIIGGKDTVNDPQYDYLSDEEYQVLSAANFQEQTDHLADDLWAGNTLAAPARTAVPTTPAMQEAVTAELTEIMPLAAPPTSRPNFQAHAKQLAAQLIKIFNVTLLYGLPSPWDNVCIGSDFDGLIDAVDCCKSAAEFSAMAAELEVQLKAIASQAGVTLDMDAAQIVKQFCYDNAINFISKHVKK